MMAAPPWWITILPPELIQLRRRLLNELLPEFGNTLGSEVEDVIQQAFPTSSAPLVAMALYTTPEVPCPSRDTQK